MSQGGAKNKRTMARNKKEKALKNDPFRFEGEGILFKGKLIGSEAVSHARGDVMCADAMNRLKSVVKASGEHKQKISLSVSLEGIKIYDEKTQELMCHHPVHRISFISQDQADPRAFGYVSGTPQGGHSFIAIKTEKSAAQVVIALRDLFQVVLEMKQHEMNKRSGSSTSASHRTHEDGAAETATPTGEAAFVDDLLDLQTELDTLQQGIDQIESEITTAEAAFGSDPFGSTSEVSQASSVIESNGYFQPNKVCLPPAAGGGLPREPPPFLPPPPSSSLPSTPKRTLNRQAQGSTTTDHFIFNDASNSGSPSAGQQQMTSQPGPGQVSMTLPKGFSITGNNLTSNWLENQNRQTHAQVTATTSMASCFSETFGDFSKTAFSESFSSASGLGPSTAPPLTSAHTQFSFESDFSKPPPLGALPPPPLVQQNATPSGAILNMHESMNKMNLASPAYMTVPRPQPRPTSQELGYNGNRVALPPLSAPLGSVAPPMAPPTNSFNAVFESARPNSGLIGAVRDPIGAPHTDVFNEFKFDPPTQRPPAPAVQREANFSATQFSFESVASSRLANSSTDMFDLSGQGHLGSNSSLGSSTVHSGSEVTSPRIVCGVSSSPPTINNVPPADKYAVFEELKAAEIKPSTDQVTLSTSAPLFAADFNSFCGPGSNLPSARNDNFFANDSRAAQDVLMGNLGRANTAGFANFDLPPSGFGSQSKMFASSSAPGNNFFETNFNTPQPQPPQSQHNFFDEDTSFEANFDAFTMPNNNRPLEAPKRPPMLNAAMRSNPFCALSTDSTPSEDFKTPPVSSSVDVSASRAKNVTTSSGDNSICSPSEATTATNQFVSAASSPSSDRFVTLASGSSLSSSENDISVPPPPSGLAPFPPFLTTSSFPSESSTLSPPPSASESSTATVHFANPIAVPVETPPSSRLMDGAVNVANPFMMGQFVPNEDEGFCGSSASSVSPNLPQKMTCSIESHRNGGAPLTSQEHQHQQQTEGTIFKKKPRPFDDDFFNMLNGCGQGQTQPDQSQLNSLW